MIDFNITEEELNALKTYINENYEAINQMLVSDSETDIALLSEDVENKVVHISYLRNSIIDYFKNIKLVYKLLLKRFYFDDKKDNIILYRGTNIAEVERIKNELFIDRFLVTTQSQNDAIDKYASNWNRPVCMNIALEKDVPYIFLKDVLGDDNDAILISPFTKIETIIESKEIISNSNSKTVKTYDLKLQKQDLDALDDKDRYGLYNHILDNSYSIKRKIEECINLEKENTINFENIRKLEQLLNKLENNEDISEDFEDIENIEPNDIIRITNELEDLKRESNDLFEARKQNIEFINNWKRNIAVYLIAECREIEKDFDELRDELLKEIEEQEKQEQEKEELEKAKNDENTESDETISENNEKLEVNSEELSDSNEIEEEKEKTLEEIIEEELVDEDKESIIYISKNGCKENLIEVKKILEKINNLISKQQSHAKVAGNIGASYSALNNAFEMRKSAEKLLELIENITEETRETCTKKQKKPVIEKLNKIIRINFEVSTLINYLNNPKIAGKNSKLDRFGEMEVIEENELKRCIAEKIREVRGEAELKKLKDDLEMLEEKGKFSRFLGIFTGQNKLDSFTMDQIEIRQTAIRKTLSKKLSLARNYSIHELMAEIQIFINENDDDTLIEEDVKVLKNIAEELRRNYIILESKVNSIIDEKEGKNLPVRDKNLSKKELIEIQTYRFLNKYGYDLNSSVNEEEPKYQDTMANEINRILEYINSADI